MPNANSFFRSLPRDLLSGLLAYANIDLRSLPEPEKEAEWRRAARELVSDSNPDRRATFESRADRITVMCDDAGETAICALGRHKATLDGLPNRYARAAWLLLNDPDGFQRAEEIRYSDERRGGRQWDGFVSARNLDLRRGAKAVEQFRSALREYFDASNIHIEIFDRVRIALGGGEQTLVQVTVYREGRPDEVLEFVDNVLSTTSRRPVYEAAITYEPATGEIEVVGSKRHRREELARLFCSSLSNSELTGERLPLRRFNLQILSQRQDFPTEPEDHIESVRVSFLRLMPFDEPGERVAVECLSDARRDIWSMASARFGQNDPLAADYRVTQAKLLIKFQPNTRSPRGRSLPVTITMPSGSDLKERSEEERLIGAKYLRRWGLLQEL